MRKEFDISQVMKSEDFRRPAALSKLCRDVDEFIPRANDAASSLYSIAHICKSLYGNRGLQAELASKVLAIVGALAVLKPLLMSEDPFFSSREVEILAESLATCGFIFTKITTSQQKLDGYLKLSSLKEGTRPEAKYNAFQFGEDGKQARILYDCFNAIMRATIVARAEYLAGRAALTDDELAEYERLRRALEHSRLKAPLVIKSESNDPRSTPLGLNTAPPPTLFDTLPSAPLLQSQPQPQALHWAFATPSSEPLQDSLPAIGQPSCWDYEPSHLCTSPTVVPLRECQKVFQQDMSGTGSPAGDSLTPASTREGTPILESFPQAIVPEPGSGGIEGPGMTSESNEKESRSNAAILKTLRSKKKPGNQLAPPLPTVSRIGEPKVSEPTSNTANQMAIPPSTVPVGPLQYLEAYIIRPHVEPHKDIVNWSYRIEHLPLAEVDMQAYMKNLGPHYSIIYTIVELLPAQLRIIQEHMKIRKGQLVAAQYGKEVDMVTLMGTFRVKSLIFVVRTAEMRKEEEGSGTTARVSVDELVMGINTEKKQSKVPRAIASDPSNDANSFPFIPNAVNRPPDWFELSDSGFFEEKDNFSTTGIQRYMSITFGRQHLSHSFEELRLADYAADRKFPSTVVSKKPAQSLCGPRWGTQPSLATVPATGGLFREPTSGGNLFGCPTLQFGGLFASTSQQIQLGSRLSQQTVDTVSLEHLKSNNGNADGSLFGQNSTQASSLRQPPVPSSSGGLFGSHQNRQSTGLFGTTPAVQSSLFNSTKTNDGGGLFGQLSAPSSSGDLFGGVQNNLSTGLFGSATATRPGGGLFGNAATAAAPPPGPFGGPMATRGGLFGVTFNNASSSGIFGGAEKFQPTGCGLAQASPATSKYFCGNYGTNTASMAGGFSGQSATSNLFSHLQTSSSGATPTPSLFANLTNKTDSRIAAFAPPMNSFAKLSIVDHSHVATASALQMDKRDGNKDSTCWLCEGKMRKDGLIAAIPDKANEATKQSTPVKGDIRSIPAPETTKQLTTERNQRFKDIDFDSEDGTEEHWFTRYDQLEARRIEDAKESKKNLKNVYIGGTAGVVSQQKWPGVAALSTRAPNLLEGFTTKGDVNKAAESGKILPKPFCSIDGHK